MWRLFDRPAAEDEDETPAAAKNTAPVAWHATVATNPTSATVQEARAPKYVEDALAQLATSQSNMDKTFGVLCKLVNLHGLDSRIGNTEGKVDGLAHRVDNVEDNLEDVHARLSTVEKVLRKVVPDSPRRTTLDGDLDQERDEADAVEEGAEAYGVDDVPGAEEQMDDEDNDDGRVKSRRKICVKAWEGP